MGYFREDIERSLSQAAAAHDCPWWCCSRLLSCSGFWKMDRLLTISHISLLTQYVTRFLVIYILHIHIVIMYICLSYNIWSTVHCWQYLVNWNNHNCAQKLHFRNNLYIAGSFYGNQKRAATEPKTEHNLKVITLLVRFFFLLISFFLATFPEYEYTWTFAKPVCSIDKCAALLQVQNFGGYG